MIEILSAITGAAIMYLGERIWIRSRYKRALSDLKAFEKSMDRAYAHIDMDAIVKRLDMLAQQKMDEIK